MARVAIPLMMLVACGGAAPDPTSASQQVQGRESVSSGSATVPQGLAESRPAPQTCPEGMLPVPGGRFVMGQGAGDAGRDEQFVHLVMVDGFCMDKMEVVQQGTKQPWVGLSWEEAEAACRARGARLPTEAEWEKAARGGCELGRDPTQCDDDDARVYPWGNESPVCTLANHSVVGPRGPKRCGDGPSATDGQSQGQGPYGHLNLAGNVWEYVFDWYHPQIYRSGRPENPGGPLKGRYRSLRGGAWDTFSTNMRVSNRFNDHLKGSTIGFRCVHGGATPVMEDIDPMKWSTVSLQVRQKNGTPVEGRWLVVTAFDAQDIDPRTSLPQPGRSPVAEVGFVPNGEATMSVELEIPDGASVRLSAALDLGGPDKGMHPAASTGGIAGAPENYTVNGNANSGITLELAPLPGRPHSPRP